MNVAGIRSVITHNRGGKEQLDETAGGLMIDLLGDGVGINLTTSGSYLCSQPWVH